MKLIQKMSALSLIFCLLLLGSGCFAFKDPKTKKLNQILQSGNDAFIAKKYDKAIEFYDAGLVLSPKHPAFLTNKSVALLKRAAEQYNESIKLTDEKEKTINKENAKLDFILAAELSDESVKIIKAQMTFELFETQSAENFKLNAFSARADTLRLVTEIVDNTRVDEAIEAANEYIEMETDKEKKTKARLNLGQMLIKTQNGEKAIVEYRKILDSDNENIEALLGMGLALTQPDEKEKFEESKIYLQKFVDKAPATHPSMTIANEILKTKRQR